MLEVLVLLRPNKNFQLPVHESRNQRRHFEIDTLLRESAAEAADIEAVRRYAAKHQLTIARVNRRTRTIILRGSAHAMSAAFGTTTRKLLKIPLELDCE
jgi:hypothetical protein